MASSYDNSGSGNAMARDETHELISASKVAGTAVYDNAGEKIGAIDDVMLEKRSGEVAYAVLSVGGFLGIGERYHPLPWDELSYDEQIGGYSVGRSGASFQDAPHFTRDELSSRTSAGFDDVDEFYTGSSRGMNAGTLA